MFLTVLTSKAIQWANDNLILESWQVSGNMIAIDHHYMDDIYNGLTDAGLMPQVDFNIY